MNAVHDTGEGDDDDAEDDDDGDDDNVDDGVPTKGNKRENGTQQSYKKYNKRE